MAAELNFKQELVGCFGYPVAENPTQAMIEPAFRDMALDWRYLTLEVKPENLPAAVAGARAFEPPPTPGLRREGSRGVEKGNY